jgi:phosphoribosylaminoimidazolecarboxamide formyltransferase/IMP cyclohydrolase
MPGSAEFRAAFNRIADYDAAISDWLSSVQSDGSRTIFSTRGTGSFVKVQDLRYGENPHQQAAYYRDLYPAPGSLVTGHQIQGKELSYNNIADADAAWECVKGFTEPACVIVKHANPCGVAIAPTCAQAYARALATDPTSAFGGIIAFNRALDGEAASAVARQFVEVLIAPSFSAEARAVFAAKPNTRLLEISLDGVDPQGATDWIRGHNKIDVKRVGSGLLMQTADNHELTAAELRVVSKIAPTPAQLQDLLFAWRVAKYVKSNAIVFCADQATVGIGAGQMSRIDSARIAGIKAAHARPRAAAQRPNVIRHGGIERAGAANKIIDRRHDRAERLAGRVDDKRRVHRASAKAAGQDRRRDQQAEGR